MELRDDDPDIALLRVLDDDGAADPATDPRLPDDVLRRAYRELQRLRLLDARMTTWQRQGRVGSYDACEGREAVPVGAALALKDGDEADWVFPALREQSVMLVRGFPLRAFVAQLFGNAGGVLEGRPMPSHPSGRAVHQVSGSPCVGSQLPQAVGAAWAMRARKTSAAAVAFLGESATSQGDFHAAMTFAGVWKVPCVLICENERGSIRGSADRQTASRTLAVKARAYGLPGVRVDGGDVLAIFKVVSEALARARSGGGATFVEAVTYRTGPHWASDDPTRYPPKTEPDGGARKDPLDRLQKHLVRRGLATPASDEGLQRELAAEIEAAFDDVERVAPPQRESLFADVYSEMPWHLRDQLECLKYIGAPPT